MAFQAAGEIRRHEKGPGLRMNRNEFPPRGWLFYQRETKWNAPNPLIDSFDETVNRIRNHRLANLPFRLTTDRAKIALELETYTMARLGMLNNGGGSSGPSLAPLVAQVKPRKSGGCGSCGGRR